jgi:hypothetical protein
MEALSTGACMISMANDDSDPGFLAHNIVLSLLVFSSFCAQPTGI